MKISILYRGPLSSCNYDCHYCPFAKQTSSEDELLRDRAGLARFLEWMRKGEHQSSILLTPWGEALTRGWYRDAVVQLSHLPSVDKVAVQTNLSCGVDWLEKADLARVGLWVSYHPTQMRRAKFLEKCLHLHGMGVRFSVGVVGVKENIPVAQRLREDLPDEIYVWINAYKREGSAYYRERELAALCEIDPLFAVNNINHASFGHRCQAGTTSFSVDGEGTVRRCHFVDEVLGNLYRDDLGSILDERPCPNETCGCHIGYVHLDRLGLYSVFGDGLMERIPATKVRPERGSLAS